MKMLESHQYDPSQLNGRNRRLLFEWRQLEEKLSRRQDISLSVVKRNAAGLPIVYLIDYRLRSICGVEHLDQLNKTGIENRPIFSDGYQMTLELPPGYPGVDAPPLLNFLTVDSSGQPIAHPWHPNIRFFGAFAGKVCINMTDTYTDLLWGVERVASYLRYDTYHAIMEPPYPEDLEVAAWVRHQGEPNGWIIFEQKTN
jgi:hypothetical protein